MAGSTSVTPIRRIGRSNKGLWQRCGTHFSQGSNVRWAICAILFAATSINYIDRQVLGIVAPVLQRSIGWTDFQYGYIIGGFQFAYAIGLILSGRMIDRLGTRTGYAIAMAVWGLAAISHAFVRTVLGFALARFFLGLGESGNFPAAVKATAEWFPKRERSLATGIFISGSSVGAIVAPAFVPWVTFHFGWQAAFLMTSVFSASWIAVWLFYYRVPSKHRSISVGELSYIERDREGEVRSVSWKEVFLHRQTWAFAIGKLLTDPIWWFYLFWLPMFLTSRFHLSLGQLTIPLVIIYNVSTIGSVLGGWLPDVFLRFGVSIGNARIISMFVCAICVTPIFFVPGTSTEWVAIGLIGVAIAAHQGWSANLLTTPSDMFPPAAVGTVVGIGGTAGSVGGVLLSISTGWILSKTHQYTYLFMLAASAYLIAIGIMLAIVPGFKAACLRSQS